MNTTLFTTNNLKLAYSDNINIRTFKNDLLIGIYESGTIYSEDKSVNYGVIDNNVAYIDGKYALFVNGKDICNIKNQCVAKFEGNPDIALSICVAFLCYKKNITKPQESFKNPQENFKKDPTLTPCNTNVPINSYFQSPKDSNKPKVIVGAAFKLGIGEVLGLIIGFSIAIYGQYILWTSTISKTLTDGNLLGLILGYMFPIIFMCVSIYKIVNTQSTPLTLEQSFRKLEDVFYKKYYLICALCSVISCIFEVLFIYKKWWYTLLVLVMPLFCLYLSIIPYIAGSVILYIILKCK